MQIKHNVKFNNWIIVLHIKFDVLGMINAEEAIRVSIKDEKSFQ